MVNLKNKSIKIDTVKEPKDLTLKESTKILLNSQREMNDNLKEMNNNFMQMNYNITLILSYLFQELESTREIINLLKKK